MLATPATEYSSYQTTHNGILCVCASESEQAIAMPSFRRHVSLFSISLALTWYFIGQSRQVTHPISFEMGDHSVTSLHLRGMEK